MSQCLFCSIIKGEIPSLKVFESDNVVAVLNIKPATKGQVIIIPKQHEPYLHSLSNQVMIEVFNAVKSVSTVITQAFNAKGFNIINNMGAIAGQRVPHVVFHLIPRYEGDNVDLRVPEGATNEQELISVQQELIKTSRDNTIKTLKAITEGKVNVKPEVKQQAEELLKKIEGDNNPLESINKQYKNKLEDLMK